MSPKILLLYGSSAILLAAAVVMTMPRDPEVQRSVAPARDIRPSAKQPLASPFLSHPDASPTPVDSPKSNRGRTGSSAQRPSQIVHDTAETASSSPSARGKRHARPAADAARAHDADLGGASGSSSFPGDTRVLSLKSPETAPPSADVLHFDGLRIEVHGFDSPENGGDLLISVTPSGESSSTSSRIPTGITLAEELFRAKWGWVAYDQVKLAARESLEGNIR